MHPAVQVDRVAAVPYDSVHSKLGRQFPSSPSHAVNVWLKLVTFYRQLFFLKSQRGYSLFLPIRSRIRKKLIHVVSDPESFVSVPFCMDRKKTAGPEARRMRMTASAAVETEQRRHIFPRLAPVAITAVSQSVLWC